MSVTAAQGFRASGVAAGLKTTGERDVAVVICDGPRHDATAVFTTNRVVAAPVVWTRQVVADGRVDAIVLNSGGANACTGPQGFQDAHRTAEHAADLIGCSSGDVAVCSTGLIGEPLPLALLLDGVRAATGSLDTGPTAARAAAEAIRTTDTRAKQAVAHGQGWVLGGMAKGAGMLAPGLATMLVVLTTDARVEPAELTGALRAACEQTFDRVDSDGCMSTNDTVLLLASGASGVRPRAEDLRSTLTEVCADLARQLVGDAEGARHDIAVQVRSAASTADALEVGRAVARSNLFKCAVFGGDPNWGRVLAAIGTTGAVFEPDRLDVSINGVTVARGGAVGADRALVDLSAREVDLLVELNAGEDEATIWTNDLTHDYVHENSAYSS